MGARCSRGQWDGLFKTLFLPQMMLRPTRSNINLHLKIALLSYNSYTILFIHLRVRFTDFQYIQTCAAITAIRFFFFFHSQKKLRLSVIPRFPLALQPWAISHLSPVTIVLPTDFDIHFERYFEITFFINIALTMQSQKQDMKMSHFFTYAQAPRLIIVKPLPI